MYCHTTLDVGSTRSRSERAATTGSVLIGGSKAAEGWI
jgi:hypothetical protein